MDHAPWQCNLSREFQTRDTKALLLLELQPVTTTTWLKVGFSDGKGKRDSGDAIMFVDGVRVPGKLHFNVYDGRDHRIQEYMLDRSRHDLSKLQKELRFQTGDYRDFTLAVPDFGKVWAAAGECMDDLYSSLGIAKSDLEQVAQPPEGWLPRFLPESISPKGPYDYVALYWVDAHGRVDSCKLFKSTAGKEFEAGFCPALMKNGRFKPAQDHKGNPVRAPVFEDAAIRIAPISG